MCYFIITIHISNKVENLEIVALFYTICFFFFFFGGVNFDYLSILLLLLLMIIMWDC